VLPIELYVLHYFVYTIHFIHYLYTSYTLICNVILTNKFTNHAEIVTTYEALYYRLDHFRKNKNIFKQMSI